MTIFFCNREFDFISGSDAPANNSKGSPAKSASPDEGGASSSNSSESPVAPAAPAKAEKTVDNWEDADNSANTPATTPEEEENSISDET